MACSDVPGAVVEERGGGCLCTGRLQRQLKSLRQASRPQLRDGTAARRHAYRAGLLSDMVAQELQLPCGSYALCHAIILGPVMLGFKLHDSCAG